MQRRKVLALAAISILTAVSAQAQSIAPASPPPQSIAGQDRLSLEQCLTLALRQASSFQQAKTNEEIAREDVSQARAAFLPRFDYFNSLIHTSPLRGQPGIANYVAANGINEYVNQLTVAQGVDLFGHMRYSLRKAEAESSTASARANIAGRDLRVAVKDAYYGLLLAQWNLRVSERALKEADDFYRLTELLFEKGEVAKADALRAEIARSTRRQERDKAKSQLIGAENDLKAMIGKPLADDINVEDVFERPPGGADFSQFTETMVHHRPEFSLFAASENRFVHEARMARAERRPQIGYIISFGFDDNRFLIANRGVSVALSIHIPLFDWGISKSRERQASLRMQQVQIERAAANRAFLSQYYTSRQVAELAQSRIREADENVRRATASLELSKRRYQAGEGSILEVLDSQNTKATTEMAYYSALSDYYMALSRLEVATGK